MHFIVTYLTSPDSARSILIVRHDGIQDDEGIERILVEKRERRRRE
jgi:hypothetical protein